MRWGIGKREGVEGSARTIHTNELPRLLPVDSLAERYEIYCGGVSVMG